MTNFNSHGVQSHNASNRNLGISSNRIAQETNDKLLTSHEKLDTLSTKLNAGLPSALTGGGHLKVCIQELGNVGSERLPVNVGGTSTQLPTALTGDGNLKVSIQEDHTHNLATSALQGGGLPASLTGSGNLKVSIEEGSSSALPTGASTSALQTSGNSSLATIASDTTSLDGKVTACNTGAVVVSGSALPTGGATSALQTSGNSSLTSIDGKVTACNTGAVVVSSSALPSGGATATNQSTMISHLSEIEGAVETIEGCVSGSEVQVDIVSSALPSGGATSALQTTGNNSLATIAGDTTSLDGKVTACNTGAVTISSSALPTGGATSALQTSGNSSLTSIDGKVTACNTGAVVVSSSALPSGGATSALQSTLNSKIDTIDAVLDTIKVDTEAIETAVEAIQALEQLTTTLIIDGQSVASGGGTHTSSSFQITKRPKGDGKLHFLIRISGVSSGEIGAQVQVSADDTNFFGVDLGFINQGTAITGVGQFLTLAFIPKHIKITLSNSSFSSNATCSVHMFS